MEMAQNRMMQEVPNADNYHQSKPLRVALKYDQASVMRQF
jgi:hypothetical protein